MVFYCGTCGKDFLAGRFAREQHCNALSHDRPAFECDTCSDCFDDEEARRWHMRNYNHWHPDAVECRLCIDKFLDEEERQVHELIEHLYCVDCQRGFQNHHNIRQVISLIRSNRV